MKSIWKVRRLWVCALLSAGLFGLAVGFEHIDRYHPFPYIAAFHALTFFSWLSGLYGRWCGRWKPEDRLAWGTLVLLCALPQAPMCAVSHVSWALLGVSAAMGLGGVFFAERGTKKPK